MDGKKKDLVFSLIIIIIGIILLIGGQTSGVFFKWIGIMFIAGGLVYAIQKYREKK